MAQQFTLAQNLLLGEVLAPAADAAGRTGSYMTLKGAHKGFAVCHIAQGNAATVLLSVLQATDVSGTSSKALANNARIWYIADTSVANPVPVRQADGVSFTTDAALKNKVVIIEVDPAMLDMANGFRTITVSTGASNAANITEAMFYGTPRSAEDQSPSPRVN
jgi:hypothetical protein